MLVKNIVVGKKYTTRDGQEKTAWTTIGACFIKDDGKMSVKIEQIPLNWDGQAQIFDRDTQGGHSTSNGVNNPSRNQQSQYNMQQNPPPAQHLPNQNNNTQGNGYQQGQPVYDQDGNPIPI